MLRDKFIHYFQQWRERQLSRGEHWLAQHLAGRSPREKGMFPHWRCTTAPAGTPAGCAFAQVVAASARKA